jgi:hypothetical protein
MFKAKNEGQYQKQYFLCILAYGVKVIQKYMYIKKNIINCHRQINDIQLQLKSSTLSFQYKF